MHPPQVTRNSATDFWETGTEEDSEVSNKWSSLSAGYSIITVYFSDQ